MSQPAEKLPRARKQLHRGRHVELEPAADIRALLGGETPRRDLLIEYLHRIQDSYGCISAAHITALAAEMKLSTTEVYEVATFYHHFDVVRDDAERPPALTVRVCESVTCEMFGSEALIASLKGRCGQDVRIQRVPCVGRCAAAPVAVVGKWQALLKTYLSGRQSLRRVFLLIDARHGPKPVDEEIMELLSRSAVTFQVVMTKCDKLKPGELAKMTEKTKAGIAKHAAAFPVIVQTSSAKGDGIDALRAIIAGIV